MNTLNLSIDCRIEPPFADQFFEDFDQWVSRASVWLTCHFEYNNTEHGEVKGWRGHHFTAMCFDSQGRRCTHGAHFRRAQEEGAFPVWWIWPDQIPELISRHQIELLAQPSEFERLCGKENSHV